MFELCEDLLDRIDVGALGRQEHEAGAPCADGIPDGQLFVAEQVVEDDDVAGRECGAELFLDPCGKAGGIDSIQQPVAQLASQQMGLVTSVTETIVWQLACLPSVEAYCGARPTEPAPFLGMAVSSMISQALSPPTSASACFHNVASSGALSQTPPPMK